MYIRTTDTSTRRDGIACHGIQARTRQRTIRVDDRLWEKVEDEARLRGISTSQFVRDAALMYVVLCHAERNGPWKQVFDELRPYLKQ